MNDSHSLKNYLSGASYAVGVAALIWCWHAPKGAMQHVAGLLALLFILAPKIWETVIARE